ncbi:MerC domain-containing protein [Erythrobacter sp.]|jgi:hypothetical protein|uniref:MerC domain-containing protein n=1 Tax=Erythrobacter sp. TaxID=1042 RepID=UPI002EB98229|nr:MerC domain-containing protein [Erythrobacter sp.]
MADPNMQSDLSSPAANRRLLDRVGIGIAGFCALHCFATIVLVSGLGVGGHFLLEPAIHETGLVLATLIATAAIGWGILRHRRVEPLIVAAAGLALMVSALFSPHGNGELLLTIAGVALVALGHALNLRGTARLSR